MGTLQYLAAALQGRVCWSAQVPPGTFHILAVQVPTNTQGVDGQKLSVVLRQELQPTWQVFLLTLTTTEYCVTSCL